MACDIHQRVLKLRDVALGLRKTVQVNSSLAAASYDCAMDSLLALHGECSQASSLSKDKNIGRFLGKFATVVNAVKELRLTADDFEKKSVIGRGHFGEVQVVREKSTGDTYAMKIMQKSHILQQADAAFFSEERDIMAWTSSPWLTSLHYAFQDQSCLYLVMDFHPGGDLLTVMERKEGGMSETEARFYLSEIAAGLHDLHQLGFVHRDVKPENVLITRSGHIKLVDFGSAARLGEDGKVIESRLPVGTPEYIAPEVLTSLDKSADYGVCCDWWSLGIIAYELLYESTPFEDDTTSKMYGNIMSYKTKLSFPEELVTSSDVKDLVKKLLTDHKDRLLFEQLKKHKFFSKVDWDNLFSVLPPYIPVISSIDDTSNFDVFDSDKHNLRNVDLSTKNLRNFSGKSLPFVGFTFTRYEDPSREEQKVAPSLDDVDQASVKQLQMSLDRVQKDLLEMKERKTSLERECVIYQSQLDDFHRKLEIEKTERRQSDSKALQLLEEVREHGRVARKMREQAASATEGDLKAVIEQLELERSTESKRSRRLKEELKQSHLERDLALKKLTELKAKLTEVKEANRKDVTTLQNKLAKVTKDSLTKAAGMQDSLLEAQERCVVTSRKLQEAEEAKTKAEYKIKQMQLKAQTSMATAEDPSDLKIQLESVQVAHDKLVKELEGLLETQQGRNKQLAVQLEKTNTRNHKLESNEMKLNNELQMLRLEVDQCHQVKDEHEKMRVKLAEKTQEVQKQSEVISNLTSSKRVLEAKVAELEKLREDATSQSEERHQRVYSAELAKWEAEVSRLESELASSNTESKVQLIEAERKYKEGASRHREEIKSLQNQLSEATNMAIQQGEKLREVRRAKRQLDQENDDLKTALRKAERESGNTEKKYTSVCEELKSLGEAKEKLTKLEKELKSLHSVNKDLEHKAKVTEREKEEMVHSRRRLESALSSAKKEVEAQELNTVMLQRNVKSLEDELADACALSEEAKAREAQWTAIKETMTSDLDRAESKLDDAYTAVEKEKNSRLSVEQQLRSVTESLEKTVLTHSEEIQDIQEQLGTQRQLASKYSDRVSELEKEFRLKQLSHKETQKDLELEKSLSSKLYDDIHSLKREHGKMKAAHMKLLSEVEERDLQLAQVTVAKEKMMEEQRNASRIHQIDRTKLEVTIDQQTKLIDYLHGHGGPSGSQSTSKKKKGFKFGRKARDPAKEFAEWNKLKGILHKPGKGGHVAKGSSSNVSLASIHTPRSISTASLDQSQSYHLPTGSSTPFPPSSSTSAAAAPLSGYLGASPKLEALSTPHLMPTPSLEATERSLKSAAQSGGDESTLDSEELSGVTTYFSVTSPEDEDHPTTTTISKTKASSASPRRAVAGKKRKAEESDVSTQGDSSSTSDVGTPHGAKPTMQHNIPHKFHLRTGGLHKTMTCAACKEVIKPLHKLTKCSYCHITCHPSCIDSLPNTCGLPPELAQQVHPQQPPPSKKHSIDTRVYKTPQNTKSSSKKKSQREAAVSRTEEQPSVASVGRVEEEKNQTDDNRGGLSDTKRPGLTIYSGFFDPSKVIRSEKVTVMRGNMRTVGWLLLTEDSLCLYDRDPRGLTRKPIHSFDFNSPGCVFLILPTVAPTRLSPSPSKHLELAFGIEKHSASELRKTVFYAETVKSKIEWVEEIEKVLSSFSQRMNQSSTTPRGDVAESPPPPPPPPPRTVTAQGRELKAVTITPVKTSLKSSSPGGGSGVKRKSTSSASPKHAKKRTKK